MRHFTTPGMLALAAAAVGSLASATLHAQEEAAAQTEAVDPRWRATTVYFLLTDRFANGDPANDRSVGRKPEGGPLRSYEGGDLKGLTHRIEQGWFNDLGVDAIWTTPVIENVHGFVDEGEWGRTYAYHGYWPKDWTAVDPNLGSEADFAAMVKAAHGKGLRVIVDVIANHAGPVTPLDPRWPETWVRRQPPCDYKTYAGTVDCELSFTLQDMRTDSEAPVALPDFLLAKWRKEGRLKRELAELDSFFKRTGYPRAPKYYLVKWLTDWVRDYGIDGFRVDTAKHVDPELWGLLKRESAIALADWRARNPERVAGDRPFYMVGEVFNHGLLANGQAVGAAYDYGDRIVDFRDHGFDGTINMGFPGHLAMPLPALFRAFDAELGTGAFKGRATLNYLASHDDMNPHDPARADHFAAAEALLLAPGGAQIYYGDEIARSLVVPGTKGDATLRSVFDWHQAQTETGQTMLLHWQKLGQFRASHPAIGAGRHLELGFKPYTFARTLDQAGIADRVVVAMTADASAPVTIRVGTVFAEGTVLRDAYTGGTAPVSGGMIEIAKPGRVVLLELAP
ncbi:MAG: alpha-amlyase [Erythrobacter sp.]|nr:alpha-amlyase [Erythrobacter sp.]